jgi:hypothetical protein
MNAEPDVIHINDIYHDHRGQLALFLAPTPGHDDKLPGPVPRWGRAQPVGFDHHQAARARSALGARLTQPGRDQPLGPEALEGREDVGPAHRSVRALRDVGGDGNRVMCCSRRPWGRIFTLIRRSWSTRGRGSVVAALTLSAASDLGRTELLGEVGRRYGSDVPGPSLQVR